MQKNENIDIFLLLHKVKKIPICWQKILKSFRNVLSGEKGAFLRLGFVSQKSAIWYRIGAWTIFFL
ncbi:MAG: hypothetical protein ACTTJG_05015 [Treponema sp.]